MKSNNKVIRPRLLTTTVEEEEKKKMMMMNSTTSVVDRRSKVKRPTIITEEKMMMKSSSSATIPTAITTTTESSSSSTTSIINDQEKSVDEVMASKLNAISMKDRSEGLYDIHGVSSSSQKSLHQKMKDETPEMIQNKLQQMNYILDNDNDINITSSSSSLSSSDIDIDNHDHDPTTSSDAYQLACLLNQDNYVDGIKILCLRATQEYDSLEASKLCLRFFTRKLQLFGSDCLTRDLQLSDLNMSIKEKYALQNGLVQLLPHRDTAGRAILWMDGKVNFVISSTKTVMRLLFYMSMIALQDIETQYNGVVIIAYEVGHGKYTPGRSKEFYINWISLPWKVLAFHYCCSKEDTVVVQKPVLMPFLKVCSDKIACRTKLHSGNHTECLYNLYTYGILKESLPITAPNGTRDLSYHHTFLDTLKTIETKTTMTTSITTTKQQQQQRRRRQHQNNNNNNNDDNIILIPSPKDVLLGQGRLPRSHPGNMRLRNLIEDHFDIYDNLTVSKEKTKISQKILDEMKNDGCKFLSPLSSDDGGDGDGNGIAFVECTDIVARKKIAHGFRNLRRDHPSYKKRNGVELKKKSNNNNNKRKSS